MNRIVGCALFLALMGVAGAKKHPFSVDDMLAMQRISDPQTSPDGKWVVYVVRTTDFDDNVGRTDLWLTRTEGGTPRRLTAHPDKDWHPRFSPDGRSVYFLSTRGGSAQVWRIGVEGGEAESVTHLPADVDMVLPLKDGRLLLALDVYPSAASLEESAKRDQEKSKSKVKALAFDQLLFRHWDTWEDGKRAHLFVWDSQKPNAPIDLMKGLDSDCPTHPFGGAEDIALAPDGKTLVYAAKGANRDAAWTTNYDLWTLDTDGKGKTTNLTDGNRAWDGNPVFSPDGKTLAYLAMARPGFEADRKRVVLYDWATHKRRVLSEAWDRSPEEIAWSADGKTIYAIANDLGNTSLFAIDLASGKVSTVSGPGFVSSVRPAPDGVVFARDTFTSPAELYYKRGTVERAVTATNAARLADIEFGSFEQFSFPGAKGDKVYGYVIRPVGARSPTQKVPVAFLVHGGPQGSWENHFHYRWNPEAYAGHGLAVVMIDFHGSTGYGQAFTDAIRGDWGGAPYEDLMTGLDFALQKFPFLDGKRMGALGASYGGYMINWLNGKTDRFRAFVCHDGNLDETMAYFDTEELWFPEWEHHGTPWENPTGYSQQSPLSLVQHWKTPTLVIHGGQDFRVVDTQGLSTFTVLQRRGIPSRLLYFPDENHWVQKPQNSKRWHQEVLAWLDRFLK